MKGRTRLGDVELEILHIVWDLGETTVAEVREVVLRRRSVAYTTVMTMMRNLARKGFLRHRCEGRTYVYRAAKAPEVTKRDLLRDTVDRVFGGSPVDLVQNLLEAESLSAEDVAEIRKMIEAME